MVGVVRDVCVSLQQFSEESSGADTLANKAPEHHGFVFYDKCSREHRSVEQKV